VYTCNICILEFNWQFSLFYIPCRDFVVTIVVWHVVYFY